MPERLLLVDEGVEAAELGIDGIEEGGMQLYVGHVALEVCGFWRAKGEKVIDARAHFLLRLAASKGDRPALACKGIADSGAYSAAATCYETGIHGQLAISI